MSDDVRRLIDDCILCRLAKTTAPTRIHHGNNVRPTGPNQVVSIDYFYMGTSYDGYNYFVVMRDLFSRFTLCNSAKAADGINAAGCLLDWVATFGPPKMIRSDNGSHFRDAMMQEFTRLLSIEQKFATAYCAWSNGGIERVMRDVTVLVKIILHEKGMDKNEWTRIKRNIMSAVNQRPSRVLSGRTPIEVHCGMDPSEPLSMIMEETTKKLRKFDWTPDVEGQVRKLNQTLKEIHEQVYDATTKVNKSARKNEADLPVFELGDYVLYSMMERPGQESKFDFKWIGPFQVEDTKSDYVYIIRNIVNDKRWDAHVTRMSFYSTQQMEVGLDLRDLISRQGLRYDIEEILEMQYDDSGKEYKVLVRWLGFSEAESCWEPLFDLMNQVPRVVLDFLEDQSERDTEIFRKLWAEEEDKIVKCVSTMNGYEKFQSIEGRRGVLTC